MPLRPRSGLGSSPSRVWTIVGTIVGALALVAGGWLLASGVQSPAQREADASPPPAGPVFATVQQGSLADEITVQGSVVPALEWFVTLPAGSDSTLSVVTGRSVAGGQGLRSGDVLTEVNGRPVFIVTSPFDFYRDMGMGDSGPDVLRLQATLVEEGYLAAADGEYGAQTARAVSRWYRDAGYSAPTRERESGTSAPQAQQTEGQQAPSVQVAIVKDAFVPANEVVAIPVASLTVLDGVDVGAHVASPETPDLVLGGTDLVARAEFPGPLPEGVGEGTATTVTIGASAAEAVLGPPSMTSADGSDSTVIMVALDDAAFPGARRGDSVTMLITRTVVVEDALLVPVNAVIQRTDQEGVLVKKNADGTLSEVPVTILGALRGTAAVAQAGDVAIVVGDEVRVG